MSDFFSDMLKWWPIMTAFSCLLVWAISQSIWLAAKIGRISDQMVTKEECGDRCNKCRASIYSHIRNREDKISDGVQKELTELRTDITARLDMIMKMMTSRCQ